MSILYRYRKISYQMFIADQTDPKGRRDFRSYVRTGHKALNDYVFSPSTLCLKDRNGPNNNVLRIGILRGKSPIYALRNGADHV
jgi:hypothetical protein